jgi:catechol 2,3-dioxygenase-like lactoylglutathione lyase family enzyme
VTIGSIHHINIRASSELIARLRQFYCEVVGLRQGWRPPFASRGYWLYAGEDPVLHLVEFDDERGTALPAGVVDHIAFHCAELEPVIARLRSHGIEFSLTQVPVLGDTQLLFRDPLEIGVELTVSKRV